MATGRQHSASTRRNAILISGACAYFSYTGESWTLLIAAGAWVGHILTPDIDHHRLTVEERRMLRRFKLLGWLWIAFWWPYDRFNAHRGRSHTWRGTVERFLYLFWLPIAATLLWLPEATILWAGAGGAGNSRHGPSAAGQDAILATTLNLHTAG